MDSGTGKLFIGGISSSNGTKRTLRFEHVRWSSTRSPHYQLAGTRCYTWKWWPRAVSIKEKQSKCKQPVVALRKTKSLQDTAVAKQRGDEGINREKYGQQMRLGREENRSREEEDEGKVGFDTNEMMA